MDCCKSWLKNFLILHGTTSVDDVRDSARAQGFSNDDLKKARKELGVKTWHQFDEEGETKNWFWYLEVPTEW